MIKIANVIEDGRLAGPQLRMLNVAQSLRKHGIATTLLIPVDKSEAFSKLISDKGINFRKLKVVCLQKRILSFLRYVVSFLFDIFRICHSIKELSPDLIHVSGGAWQFKSVIAAKLSGGKVIWHLNDTSMPMIIRLVFGLVSHMCTDAFIVAGEKVRNTYLSRANNKKIIHTIGAPVDTKRFSSIHTSYADKLQKLSDKFKIITVANINPNKGIDLIIEIAGLLRNEVKFQFVIVGPIYKSQEQYYKRLLGLIQKKNR